MRQSYLYAFIALALGLPAAQAGAARSAPQATEARMVAQQTGGSHSADVAPPSSAAGERRQAVGPTGR
jgi:hypothetical protein